MTLAAEPVAIDDSLRTLRCLRARQAVTLAVFAGISIVVGAALFAVDGRTRPFWNGVAWQFVTWGAIDAIFAATGIIQAYRVTGKPPCPQAEADEFLAAEKLLRTLHFNQKLNWLWVGTGIALLVWAAAAHSAALAGHGVGVIVQGGFLFVFDLIYAARFERLLFTTPPEITRS